MNDQTAQTISRPSQAWRERIFNLPPCREIKGRSRPTQRFAFESDCNKNILYAEGGNELTAMLLFEHLWRVGYVVRYKPQPLNLLTIGGPDAIPDFLVELSTDELHIVEVKSGRFVTESVLNRFEMHRSFLKDVGIAHHLWTDTDPRNRTNKLNRETWHAVRHVYRGRSFELDASTRARLEVYRATGIQRLGELMGANLFSWDQLVAAIHQRILHIDITRAINENTKVLPTISVSYYQYLFKDGDASASWWDSLPSM